MKKLEKIPMSWEVINKDNVLMLVDQKGKVKSSIVYGINEDSSGKKFLELISVASGKEQGRGYYGVLYSGLESFARTQGVNYISGFIKPENTRSLLVHQHFGFSNMQYLVYGNGREKRIHVEKQLSI